MLSSRPTQRVGHSSSIPQSTPRHKLGSDLESTNARETFNNSVPRKKDAPPSLNDPNLLDRQSASAALAMQQKGPFLKKTAIPQPGLPLLGKPKPSGSHATSVSAPNGYTKHEVTAVKSNVGLHEQGRSRSQVIRSRVPNQPGRVPSHESRDGRTAASAASGRTVSQRSMKSSTSVSVAREPISGYDEGLPEEIRHIQRELLKLHILHSTSANTQDQLRTSAKVHFHKRFEALKERHAEIADLSYQTQELRNRLALVDWCRNAQGSEIGRRVHLLSACIHEIYHDVGFSGRYNHALQTFQTWYDRAEAIRESRKHDTRHDTAHLGYVEEIGADWHNDVDALQRRLGTLTGDLRALGSAGASSNLGRVLVQFHDLVIDMLTELDCIRSIEGELVSQERLWFDEQIRMLSLKVHSEMEGPSNTPCKNRRTVDVVL